MANENNTNVKRNAIDLLPSYFQTDSLKKFFDATVNHLFQPESVEFLDGYVGKMPLWSKPASDFYISEPDNNRKNYQLAPTIVSSVYQNPEISNAMFYEDLLRQLNFQGALTNNHTRLFEQEYYSWSPPINIDMFVNYTNYYWLPNGPAGIILLNSTDLNKTAVGNQTFAYIGTAVFTADNSTSTFTEANPLYFTTGLKIIPSADATVALNGNEYIVDGVGDSINLLSIKETISRSWDLYGWNLLAWDSAAISTATYVTIERGSFNSNQWSINNSWYHIDVIKLSKTNLNTLDLNIEQAARPIIQFDRNLELYNYGYNYRGIISIVDTTNTDFFNTVVGQPHWSINGVPLQDGMRVLPLADSSSTSNGRIFVVSGVAEGAIQLTVDYFGCLTVDGLPTVGDRATVQFGQYQNMNILYTSSAGWTTNCQQFVGLEPPLFALYDAEYNSLDNALVYPSSSFKGSYLFSYQIDTTQATDQYIGMPLAVDQFGDWIFNNNLTTDQVTYVSNNQQVNYVGYLFAKSIGSTDTYTNSWYTAPQKSRQYIINEFVTTTTTSKFIIDQPPASQIPNTLPTIFVTVVSNQKEVFLQQSIDYTIENNVVTLLSPVPAGTIVTISSWNSQAPAALTGYYQLPLNLSANPNNLPVTTLSRNQFLQQFKDIIQNQTGFQGSALGINNYRDTAKHRGLGLSILQHSAPLLKLGVTNSVPLATVNVTTSYTDPMQAMQYAENSYTRFYNRLLNSLFGIATQQGFSASSNPAVCNPYNTNLWLTSALNKINIGKTSSSPWANTGYGSYPGAYGEIPANPPMYIPATATRLGITSAFAPMVYYDKSYTPALLTIQTHDGARIVMTDSQGLQLGTIANNQDSTTNPEQLTNPVAAAWLQFELNMFNNLPPTYSNIDVELPFNINQFAPGKWRTSDYSRSEFLDLQRGFFNKWAVQNGIDYKTHTTYSSKDPFTYNYSSVPDKQGLPIPGGWQGIYRWFYDTDRPHSHPWEMLGFSQEPTWWQTEYGPAPYTNGNTALWNDLRDGLIRHGERAGVNIAYARPGLLSCIPVDSQGALLPPVLAGCAAYIPSQYDAQLPWVFGDGGPIESVWINSQYYPFVQAMVGYLMKPALFIESTWDSLRTVRAYKGTANSQLLYVDTWSRRSSSQFFINRENPSLLVTGTYVPNESTSTYFASAGFQVWLTEYLAYQNLSITAYLGDVIRGANVQLGHRMAGYINASSFRSSVDSFGQLGFSSQIIPSENIKTYLYRSASTATYFYSGVIIQQTAKGWAVSGYDAINPYFTIIPSDKAGPKTTVVVGNAKIIEYTTALVGESQVVLYNTVFSTSQEVYDFLMSYGRWLSSQGWIFDSYDSNLAIISNWSQSAKEFLLWSQGNWSNGTLFAVSPGATNIQFSSAVGMIQYVNGLISGTYPAVDNTGKPIQLQDINVTRNNTGISLKPINNAKQIYGVRLYTTTFEHAVFWDNFTDFGDTIYNPLYNLQQQRVKIYAYRANNWTGTIDAPGYIITQTNNTINGQTSTGNTWTLTDNFEKTVSNFTRYFNIDEPKNYDVLLLGGTNTATYSSSIGAVDNQNLSKLAKHLIGYQPRQYLQNLLFDESVEFQFYQGFIRQKGTLAAINALLRSSTVVPLGTTFNYYDEWMIRVGTYGATALNTVIEWILPQSLVTVDPQCIRLFSATSNNPNSGIIDIVPNDPLLITPPDSISTEIFIPRTSLESDLILDIPTAGYVQFGETTFYVKDYTELLQLYTLQANNLKPIQPYDTVWQFITGNGEWMVWTFAPVSTTIEYTIPSNTSGQPTVIVTSQPHGLLNGDLVVLENITGVTALYGTYVISQVTSTTFAVSVSTFTPGSGGKIYVYRPLRFANLFQRDTSPPPGGYQTGMLAYIDDGGIQTNAWAVYQWIGSKFVPYRQQQAKINTRLIQSSKIYNIATGENLVELDYWDPAKSQIPGQARKEINYITDFDPALYTNGAVAGSAINQPEAWTSSRIGQVWWDVSQVRYIDYEQGDESYRIQHWGKIAPGTQVMIYEWVESSVAPADWAVAVANKTTITVNNTQVIPSGQVKIPYNWTEVIVPKSGQGSVTKYYYWVGNSGLSPTVSTRSLSTAGIAAYITNPAETNTPWYAAISANSLLVGNIQHFISGNNIAQRISYTSQENNENTYSQWELIRENDPNSPINTRVWSKLKDSLVTFDGLGNDVPNYQLTSYNKYGTLVRPRQTWFKNHTAACQQFVQTFNKLVSQTSAPLVYDQTKTSWRTFFEAAESLPLQYNSVTIQVLGTSAPNTVVVQTTDGLHVGDTIVFASDIDAATAGTVYYIVKIYSQTAFSISTIPNGSEIGLNTTNTTSSIQVTSIIWDYQVSSLTERDKLIGAISLGQKILVGPTQTTQNLWTIWEYTNVSGNEWLLVRIQNYNVNNYWQYVNWYAPGYNAASLISQTVPTVAELNLLAGILDGQIVQVTNGGDGNFQWYAYSSATGQWQLVCQQNGSIEILQSVYQWNQSIGGFDSQPFDSSGVNLIFNPIPGFDSTAAIELAYLIDGIYNSVFPGPNSLELNTLFFSMINFVVAEQTNIDWIFKTSNMTFTGFNQPLEASPILAVDNTNSILSFINEVKPYHAQIQSYVNGYSVLANGNVSIVDFDVPVSYLTATTPVSASTPNNISISTSNLTNQEYLSTYTSWFNNYQPTANGVPQFYIDPTLIRNLSTKIVFDRIATPATSAGWGAVWDIFGWSFEDAGTYGGAKDRIAAFYQPTPGMLPNVLSNLMQGVVYKGQILGNLGFQLAQGWDQGPWGGTLAWDATSNMVESYLDQIIQGGALPQYTTAIGDGSTVQFPLLPGAQNPNNLVVWSDGQLRLYAAEWTVPTFATNAYVVSGGYGYSTGDQLNLIAGNSVVPVRLQVENTINGSITSVKILGKGLYSVVTPGPYAVEYLPTAPGLGQDAVVNIDWDCSSIQFITPPASSNKPNIFVLYVGTTFEPAPDTLSSINYDGYQFVQPNVDDKHPEELFPFVPRDSVSLDVYSVPVNGRPLVSHRTYITDGITDQYDLLILPQSDQSIMAYLDGVPLVIGVSGQAVINYNTRKLVFINTPTAGQTLFITSIGFGGSSQSVANAYIVSGGLGYQIGDTITIAANMAYPPAVSPAVLNVTGVDSNGAITSVDVFSPGLYPRLPAQPVNQSSTSGSGTAATFNLTFTNRFEIYKFTGDGSNSIYTIPNFVPFTTGVLAVVDGTIAQFTYFANGIQLSSIPVFGSSIIIAVFADQNFSTVTETIIDIQSPFILDYTLNASPGSTQPAYLSTLVRRNGELVAPPTMQQWSGDGTTVAFNITISIAAGSISVWIDDVVQPNTAYSIQNNTITFALAPADQSTITLLYDIENSNYVLSGGQIIFAGSNLIQSGDRVIVTTYNQDIDYQFRTDEYEENSKGLYVLSAYPSDTNSIQVWYNSQLQIPGVDYSWTTTIDSTGTTKLAINLLPGGHHSSGWGLVWDDVYYWDYASTVVITYLLGRTGAPALEWRTTIAQDQNISSAVDAAASTILLGDLYTFSTAIPVADYTVLSQPEIGRPGLVYINNELISFTGIQPTPSIAHPNGGTLTGISRNRYGTSGSPQTLYNAQWYNGDGSNRLFATEAANQAISTVVYVNRVLQVENTDYIFVNDPIGQPAGQYVQFIKSAPSAGTKNVQVIALNQIGYQTQVSHVDKSQVIDAGYNVQIPGGYQWFPTPNGMQYDPSATAVFLRSHSN